MKRKKVGGFERVERVTIEGLIEASVRRALMSAGSGRGLEAVYDGERISVYRSRTGDGCCIEGIAWAQRADVWYGRVLRAGSAVSRFETRAEAERYVINELLSYGEQRDGEL